MILADSTLRNSYDNSIGYLFSTTGGSVVASLMALVAVILFVILIFALIMKGLGRQNRIVSEWASDGKRIILVIVAIIVLLGPIALFPVFASVLDKILTGGTDFLTHYLESV